MVQEQHVRVVGDTVAASTIIGSLLGWLPAIAAGIGIVWYALLFYEKITGRPFHKTKFGVWLHGKLGWTVK